MLTPYTHVFPLEFYFYFAENVTGGLTLEIFTFSICTVQSMAGNKIKRNKIGRFRYEIEPFPVAAFLLLLNTNSLKHFFPFFSLP